jgi:hypothetical protein
VGKIRAAGEKLWALFQPHFGSLYGQGGAQARSTVRVECRYVNGSLATLARSVQASALASLRAERALTVTPPDGQNWNFTTE